VAEQVLACFVSSNAHRLAVLEPGDERLFHGVITLSAVVRFLHRYPEALAPIAALPVGAIHQLAARARATPSRPYVASMPP
jgi:hypothetical protein